MLTASSLLEPLNRIAASLLGGYAFTWGTVALGIAFLVTIGVSFEEAETIMMLVAFFIFLGAFFWSFSAANMRRVWLVLGVGAAITTAGAWGLQALLI